MDREGRRARSREARSEAIARSTLWAVAGLMLLGLLAAACTTAGDGDGDDEDTRSEPSTEVGDHSPSEEDPPEDRGERRPPPRPETFPTRHAIGEVGVSAGHPAAVDAGLEVLADGGSAVDAAIAAAFAISVVEPFASGLGGGGAALVHLPDGETESFDYRDEVPVSGNVPASNTGVPGFLAGMAELHEEHGAVDFERLVDPAISLAEDGVATTEILDYWLRSGRVATSGLDHLFPGGSPLSEGDELVQEELGETLRAVAEQGPRSMYDGPLGEELASTAGAIDTESLAAYAVRRPEPPTGEFAGYRVLSSAPPLAGATVIQLLQLAEAAGIADVEPGSADYIHTLSMAWRIAEDRLDAEVGDPEFLDVPVGELTDAGRNAELAEQIQADSMVGADHHGPDDDRAVAAADGNTTHITVMDSDGTMVAMTNTLSNFFGSGNYAMGFFLNDQLRNFGNRAGSPNEPPEAGKRTVASSSPTILLDDDGRPVLGLGSPGGRRIPTILAQVLTRWALHGQGLEEAVEASRFHGDGGTLVFEDMPSDDVLGDLSGRGHGSFGRPNFPYYFGSVQALEVDYEADEIRGAVDPRRAGDWRAQDP